MTKAEQALCEAAMRRCFWGGRPASNVAAREKFDYWERRLRRAAWRLYREREPAKKDG